MPTRYAVEGLVMRVYIQKSGPYFVVFAAYGRLRFESYDDHSTRFDAEREMKWLEAAASGLAERGKSRFAFLRRWECGFYSQAWAKSAA